MSIEYEHCEDGGVIVNPDTSDKLWDDCEDLIHRIQNRTFSGRDEVALRDQFAELLDRQKAITEREYKAQLRRYSVENAELNTDFIEMGNQLTDMENQRDELQSKVDELTKECDRLEDRVEELVAETDEWRELFNRNEKERCDALMELDAIEQTHIKLPVDADGVPIKIGDVMEGVVEYDALRNATGKVIEISFSGADAEGCEAAIAVKEWSKDGKSWRKVYLDPFSSVYHHVKQETVEDIIAEAMSFACEPEAPYSKSSKYVRQYAERIRKAMEE